MCNEFPFFRKKNGRANAVISAIFSYFHDLQLIWPKSDRMGHQCMWKSVTRMWNIHMRVSQIVSYFDNLVFLAAWDIWREREDLESCAASALGNEASNWKSTRSSQRVLDHPSYGEITTRRYRHSDLSDIKVYTLSYPGKVYYLWRSSHPKLEKSHSYFPFRLPVGGKKVSATNLFKTSFSISSTSQMSLSFS